MVPQVSGLLASTTAFRSRTLLASVRPSPQAGVADPSQGLSYSEIAGHDDVSGPEKAAQPTQGTLDGSGDSFKAWEKESFGFGDVLDILNPLQHLPVVSTIYRSLNGDNIGAVPRLIGGALYGRLSGIAGLVSSMVNAIIGVFTGKDVGEHIYAMLFGDPHTPKGETVVAGTSQADKPSLSDGTLEVENIPRHAAAISSSSSDISLPEPETLPQPLSGPAQAPDSLPAYGKSKVMPKPRQALLTYGAVEGRISAVAAQGRQIAAFTTAEKTRPSSPGILPPLLIPPQPWVTHATNAALDIYERIGRVGVVLKEKTDLIR